MDHDPTGLVPVVNQIDRYAAPKLPTRSPEGASQAPRAILAHGGLKGMVDVSLADNLRVHRDKPGGAPNENTSLHVGGIHT